MQQRSRLLVSVCACVPVAESGSCPVSELSASCTSFRFIVQPQYIEQRVLKWFIEEQVFLRSYLLLAHLQCMEQRVLKWFMEDQVFLRSYLLLAIYSVWNREYLLKWFIEDQVFCSRIWSSPIHHTVYGTKNTEMLYRDQFFCSRICSSPTPSPPLSSQEVVSLSQSSCVSPIELTDGRRGGGGSKEPNHTAARKSGPLYIIQYSLV
jgi:hypothetical protein